MRKLLVFFAHPDDESFGCGGTLSHYAHTGSEVHLVTATLGEAGKIADPSKTSGAPLNLVRLQELHDAAQILGLSQVINLRFADKFLRFVDPDKIVQKLVYWIRQIQPDVIITFDQHGVSNHPDHIVMHHCASLAYQLSGRTDQYPSQLATICNPHQAKKLYYYVVPESYAEYVNTERLHLTPLKEITTIIDNQNYVEDKLNAIACHRTQALSQRRYRKMTREEQHVLRRYEYFILSPMSIVKPHLIDGAKENDLFAGLE